MRPDDSPQLAALRRELDKFDHEVPLPTHDVMIERLRSTYPYSITLIERSDGSWGPRAYNCLMHALDLRDLGDGLMNLEAKVQQLDIGSAFARDLVTGGLEEIPDAEAGEGSVAIYFTNGVPVHAGQNGLVRSKWGPTGHLWQHGLFELLAEYGEEVRFFRRLGRDQIVARFTSHVERLIQAREKEASGPQEARRSRWHVGLANFDTRWSGWGRRCWSRRWRDRDRVNPRLAVYSYYVLRGDSEISAPSLDDVVASTRTNYDGALELGEDLMRIEIGDTIEVNRFTRSP